MNLSFERLQTKDIPATREVFEDTYSYEQTLKFLSEKQNIAFVAKLDGVVIGLIYGYELTCMDKERPQFLIYSVDIYDAYQDRGYGQEFVKFVVDWARENGYCESWVLTHKDNPRACKVYEKAGMTHSETDCERMYEVAYEEPV
ncbi:MAG: GNAT family N-acetyltransferase [Oscillospiraceae bacterium]|nr:GNAT family N-acetyltransferase [Oscillospiraceae bacterium]